MKKLLILLAAAFAILAVPACTIFQDPAKIEGALPEEANTLRLLKATLIVDDGYQTVEAQLDKGLVTKAEGTAIVAQLDKIREAIKQAEPVVAVGGATTAEKLALVEGLLNAYLLKKLAGG